MAEPNTSVYVLIPAKDAADTIVQTIKSLSGSSLVAQIMVIDDGSSDGTGKAAENAGAKVLTLPGNIGKGGAVAAGVAATPEAGIYLLVDADTGLSAGAAVALLTPILAGDADLAIGNLPSAGNKAGLGLVSNTARWGIRKASGYNAVRPLSGQRAIRGELLRSLDLAPRYGMEVSMTVDAVRSGARLVELPVDMTHRHTGRSVGGFAHRARQGIDVVLPLAKRMIGELTVKAQPTNKADAK